MNTGNVSGGKRVYGEMCQKWLYEKPLSKFNIIKKAIYSKDKKTQKVGWEMYHDLPSQEQKAFKAEIRKEEKTHKPK